MAARATIKRKSGTTATHELVTLYNRVRNIQALLTGFSLSDDQKVRLRTALTEADKQINDIVEELSL